MFSPLCSLNAGLDQDYEHLHVLGPSLPISFTEESRLGQVSHYQGETEILKRLERPQSRRGLLEAPYFSMEQFNTKHLVNPQ